jgi:hypothetical protein
MAKLKLSAVENDRPVKLTVELPAAVHRDLVAYADVLARQNGQKIEPAKLVAPMPVGCRVTANHSSCRRPWPIITKANRRSK